MTTIIRHLNSMHRKPSDDYIYTYEYDIAVDDVERLEKIVDASMESNITHKMINQNTK